MGGDVVVLRRARHCDLSRVSRTSRGVPARPWLHGRVGGRPKSVRDVAAKVREEQALWRMVDDSNNGHRTGNDNATATRSRDHRAGGGATRRVRVTLAATHPGLPVHRRHPLESLRCAAHEHTLHGSWIPTPQCHRNAKLTRIMLSYKMRRCQSPPVWQENKLGDRKRASESLEQVAKERIVTIAQVDVERSIVLVERILP